MREILDNDKVDRLIIEGARITEEGRLDFPSRIPFCYCNNTNYCGTCILRKLRIYLDGNGRLFEETNLAIGKCYPIILKDKTFPDLYSPLDNYSKEYYEERILPIILMFYKENFIEELFNRVWPK